MIGPIESYIRKVIREELAKVAPSVLTVLKPDKQYILVLPNDLGGASIQEVLKDFDPTANILVVQADGVKLIELS